LYRYAFQGQELDKETGMEAFQLRLWDGRIGRWLSTDPYGQYASPYLGMGNNPINGIDPDGGLWKEGNNGQIVAEDGDNAATLATYMKIDIKEAAKILAANGVKTNNGILDLKIGQEIAPIVVFGGGKKKGSTSFNNFRSNLINISFDKNADNPVNPKLTNYLSEVIKKASKQGIFSINVSSTTNHSSNSKNSAHSFSNGARALDINYINGVHVSPNDRNSKILQKIIQSTPGWRENYGPSIIQKMNNGTPILAPWARDIKGGHFDHVHISVPK
jgi:RHS repeat-associated protein